MKISIIGYGNMGSSLAEALVRAGHQVTLTGRSLEKATAVAEKTGSRALPASEASKDAEVIIATTPYDSQVASLRSLGDLRGKVVIDISNPLKPDMSGLQIGHSTSAAEEVAKQLPGVKIIKAFNTVFAQVLQDGPQFKNGKAQVFFAGDEDSAKTKVKSLIESLGFEATDAGPLANSRYLEPMGMLNIWLGYMAKKGTGIAPAWISRG
jgi:8-hydroxy-5-deazaflavin:NADPH oxidoreductase